MAEEVKKSPTQPKPKTVRAKSEDVEVIEEVEAVEEVTPAEEVAVEPEDDTDGDVEAMGKRGRKSKAQIVEEHKKTRQDIESNYANLIAFEPAKADLFRAELEQTLKNLGL